MAIKLSNLVQRPTPYVLACILCSLGGFLYGVDTGIIGPVTVMKQFTNKIGNTDPTIHGLIVSSILIPAAITSFLAGRVADALGRPACISIGAGIFGLGTAIEAGALHIGMFIAGRVVSGIGEGLYMGTLVVYICEISPARHRGALTTGPQLLVTCGLLVGFFTCFGSTNIPSSLSWRLPFILLTVYSALFAFASFALLPPSPRWLANHGKETAVVTAAWEKLGILAADREDIRSGEDGTRSKKDSMLALFSRGARRPFFLAVFLMGMQQLSGIDGVLYYAPLLFQQAGIASTSDTFLASGVSAIVIFAVTIPATIWADSWSRRRNAILGGLGMSATMFLIGGLYAGKAVHAGTGTGRWLVVISIYIFTVLYCISWAGGMKIFAAEIQPQNTRASATGIAHGSNWLANFLVALVTPTLLAQTSYGAYFLFGSCLLLTAIVCMLFMPETRGRTLSEIQSDGFGVNGVAIRMGKSIGAVRRRFVKSSTAQRQHHREQQKIESDAATAERDLRITT